MIRSVPWRFVLVAPVLLTVTAGRGLADTAAVRAAAALYHGVQAETLPNGRRYTLAGQTHDISPDATAAALAEFLAG